MIDEFQDTNAVQLGILRGARARQPVRGRRRVPVDLPLPARRREHLPRARDELDPREVRAPGGQLPLAARSCWTCSTRRSRPSSASASRRCGPAARSADGRATARCGCSTLDPPAGQPPVELLVTGTQGWDELAPRLGLAQGGDQPWRRAEARLIADRLRSELDDGRRAGDMVVLVRATATPAAARGGAGGAGPADLRRRRPRLLVARSRSATASRGCACSPTRTTRRRCSPCSSSPFHGAGTDELVLLAEDGRERGSLWDAVAGQRQRGRAAARRRARARRARAAGGAARARDRRHGLRPRRRSPAPAATAAWRTCAS